MTVFKLNLFCLILFVTMAFSSYGQDTISRSEKTLYSIKDLHLIDSSEAPSIIGEFTLSDGFGGYGYQFDGKGIFKRRDFGCLSNHVSDSGSYKFTGLWQLELTSKHQKAYFFVYRFYRFLFLVAQSKTELFKRQFVSFANVFYNAKPYALEDERYTDQFFIAFSLIKTHLTRLE